jgi:integrase
MRAKITKRGVDALRVGESIADTEVRGFIARRLKSGTVTYSYRYRARLRRQRQPWVPLGLHGQITPDQARSLAKKCAGEVADGRDPAAERSTARAAAANTVNILLDRFLERYVRKQNLRSADEIERAFAAYVRPRLGNKPIYDLGRRDVVNLLDEIEDKNGPVMADRTLAYLRKAFNWQATRDETFNSPVIKGMARTKPKERARTRILEDQEIRDLRAALDELGTKAPGCYPAFVWTLLMTAQRREEVSRMRWEEITGETWAIPGARYKTKLDTVVPLTNAVKALLGAKRKSGFVFSTDGGRRAFSGFSKAKEALDRKIAEVRKRDGRPPMPSFVHHDLRRTARSLMSRAGVPSDHAERALGHVIPGVRGVYDRYEYADEKRRALEALAAQVERILHPSDTVVTLPKRPKAV